MTQPIPSEAPIRLLSIDTTVTAARGLVPRGCYGIVVDEEGRPATCLFDLARSTRNWPEGMTLGAMRTRWPGLITLPAGQAADDRRVALYLWDELAERPNVPAVVLVDEQGRPVAVLSRHRLNLAVPELAQKASHRGPDSREMLTEPLMEHRLVTRYGSLQMPSQVQLRRPCTLKLAISLQASGAAGSQVELALRARSWPLHVVARLVNVRPEDFSLDDPDYQVIEVPKDRDSAIYSFTLTPQSLGEKAVRVQFWHANRFIAETKVTTQVVAGQPALAGDARVDNPPVLAYAGPPPDFTLCIERAPDSTRTYRVCVKRAGDDPRLPPQPLGDIQFESEPAAYMESIYGKLNKQAQQPGGAATGLIDRLNLEGGNLYRALFSDRGLQDFYWQEMQLASSSGRAPVVQVVSAEPSIAWELVRPWRRPAAGLPESDPLHLCERFALTRWLSNAPGPSADLRLCRIVIVAPSSNLKYVQAEVDALTALAVEAGLTCQVIATKAELVELLENGDADVLHFACHGKFDLQEAQSSLIKLGTDIMEAGEIVGDRIGWNGRRAGREPVRPLVFFNVCDSGQIGLGLTGLDGWAERFLQDADAGFFIGSIWKTNDALASQFAQGFYRRLFAGTPVAEALRQARADVKQGGDATYLTYSVFADPQATVGVASASAGGSHG